MRCTLCRRHPSLWSESFVHPFRPTAKTRRNGNAVPHDRRGYAVRSIGATREVSADEFFTGLFSTTLEPGELLVGVDIPSPQPRTAFTFDEISRRHGDFALAGAAACVSVDADGVCTSARVALLSVADKPVLAHQAAKALVGGRPSTQAIRDGAEASARIDIDPTTDIHASSRYRRRLAAVLVRRVLERAFLSLETA